MKKIIITQRLMEISDYYEVRDALDVKWAKLCSRLNYLPILLPSHYDFRQYFRLIKIAGIILSGGNDLGTLSNSLLDKKRDELEKRIIRFAIEKGIPIFGVCRGMQIIADYFHSSFKRVSGHIGIKHKLIVSENSKFKQELKKIKFVNSFHCYGIKHISNDLTISAECKDGVIEALEHRKYKIFGQMWHSERNQRFSEYELRIIRKLFR